MQCHLCSPARALHQSLLDHLLAEHPTARAAAALTLTLGTIALSRRPNHLLTLYGLITIGALLMAGVPRESA
jgi:hypothetical protein